MKRWTLSNRLSESISWYEPTAECSIVELRSSNLTLYHSDADSSEEKSMGTNCGGNDDTVDARAYA